jgi:hypothetical protein
MLIKRSEGIWQCEGSCLQDACFMLSFSLQLCLCIYANIIVCHESWVSLGSIVSDYGLDDRVIGVRSPAGAKDFSSILCVQTGSGAHPASYPMGTGGVTLTTHPHLVPRLRMSRSYTSSPPKWLHGM